MIKNNKEIIITENNKQDDKPFMCRLKPEVMKKIKKIVYVDEKAKSINLFICGAVDEKLNQLQEVTK